jgi:hypoxanthine phosphoribosyltransferase
LKHTLEVLIEEAAVQQKVREMAEAIKADFGTEPLLLVAVLKGSYMFVSDLCRHLGNNVEVDFVQVSSYNGGTVSSGNIQIRKDLDINIEGMNVVIIEDIIDSGATLDHLLAIFRTREPKALKVAALLSKPDARRVNVPVDYFGFEIPNVFVVGYGLDLAEKYRNLTYIGVLRQD